MALHLCYALFDSVYAFRCLGVNAGSLRSKAPLLAGAHSKPGKLWGGGSLSDHTGLTTETTLSTGACICAGSLLFPNAWFSEQGFCSNRKVQRKGHPRSYYGFSTWVVCRRKWTGFQSSREDHDRALAGNFDFLWINYGDMCGRGRA